MHVFGVAEEIALGKTGWSGRCEGAESEEDGEEVEDGGEHG